MKTLLKITKDNYSESSYGYFKEDINYLVNNLHVYCSVKNNSFNNIVEDEKNYQTFKNDFDNKIEITAKGYCQSDWQVYVLSYNEYYLDTPEKRMEFSYLVKQLERSFTHFNDYFCEKFEYTEINGRKFINPEAYDTTFFIISHTEFPEIEDIKKEYNEIYGIDYDEIEIIEH